MTPAVQYPVVMAESSKLSELTWLKTNFASERCGVEGFVPLFICLHGIYWLYFEF